MLLMDEIAGAKAQEVGQTEPTKLKITVRELLHTRVELEWRAAEEASQAVKAQVQEEQAQLQARRGGPTEGSLEVSLNTRGARGLGLFADQARSEERKLERMFKAAEEGFRTQRLFVLLDDRQALDLDEEIDVAGTGTATFLLLTPLQGG